MRINYNKSQTTTIQNADGNVLTHTHSEQVSIQHSKPADFQSAMADAVSIICFIVDMYGLIGLIWGF